MKNSFKILFSILSFFFFGITEGLAFVEISENKNEALVEAEADPSPNFTGDAGVKKIFKENQESKALGFVQKSFLANTVANDFSLSSLALKSPVFSATNSTVFLNEGTKRYLLFHRLIYYI